MTLAQVWQAFCGKNGLPQAIKDKLLFLGYYAQITDGKMPNTLGSDWLGVSGVAGSETYNCPDNATYKTADEDYIWGTTSSIVRNVTTAELIGYDFARTFVWYGDASPNNIVAIAILKSGEILTSDESNIVRTYFHLSLWWDGTLSLYGRLKDNRSIGRSYWFDWMETEAISLIMRMIDINEEPVRDRKVLINRNIKSLKDAGYWARMDMLCLYAAHAVGSSKLNWIKDDFNSTYMTGSVWTADRGIKTSGSTGFNDVVKTDFIPSIDASKMSLNSASLGVYYRENNRGAVIGYEGCISTSGATRFVIGKPTKIGTNTYYIAINGLSKTATINEALTGLFIGTRTSATRVTLYFNGVVKVDSNVSNSVALADVEMYLGGLNLSGVLNNLNGDEKAMSFVMDGLTAEDVAGLQSILVDDYLFNIGAKV